MNPVVWEKKIWGRAAHLNEPDVSVSMLHVDAGLRCSRHYHEHRWNCFRVITGRIRVIEWKCFDGVTLACTRQRVLGPGESCDVAPMQWHCFEVIKSGTVVEIYWTTDGTPVDMNDIVRYDEGGPVDVSS